jgi:hypothetical protein
MELSSRSQHTNTHLFSTENAPNRFDLGQKAFENRVKFDGHEIAKRSKTVIVYRLGHRFTGWYDTSKKHGYVCAMGLPE